MPLSLSPLLHQPRFGNLPEPQPAEAEQPEANLPAPNPIDTAREELTRLSGILSEQEDAFVLPESTADKAAARQAGFDLLDTLEGFGLQIKQMVRRAGVAIEPLNMNFTEETARAREKLSRFAESNHIDVAPGTAETLAALTVTSRLQKNYFTERLTTAQTLAIFDESVTGHDLSQTELERNREYLFKEGAGRSGLMPEDIDVLLGQVPALLAEHDTSSLDGYGLIKAAFGLPNSLPFLPKERDQFNRALGHAICTTDRESIRNIQRAMEETGSKKQDALTDQLVATGYSPLTAQNAIARYQMLNSFSITA